MRRLIVCAFTAVLCGQPFESATAQTFEIESEGGTICAAFTYAPGLVATAAHCTGNSQSFQLSVGGTAMLRARGNFDRAGQTEAERTAQDVALLWTNTILPRSYRLIERDPRLGETLRIAPPGAPFQDCTVLARMGDAFDLGCSVQAGWSGAPILTKRLFGQPQLIGVVSGRVDHSLNQLVVMVHARALRRIER